MGQVRGTHGARCRGYLGILSGLTMPIEHLSIWGPNTEASGLIARDDAWTLNPFTCSSQDPLDRGMQPQAKVATQTSASELYLGRSKLSLEKSFLRL